MMHPSVCLVPAILAVGEREGSSGRDVVLAYAAGFELFARLCRAMNPGHYAAGWHATSTAGTVAAGAAVARLLGLDATGIATAIGIAASSAAGIRQNFGSMVKPLHAGNAAFHGVAAAELAARGFTAALDSLDGPRGFVAVFGGDPPPELHRRDVRHERAGARPRRDLVQALRLLRRDPRGARRDARAARAARPDRRRRRLGPLRRRTAGRPTSSSTTRPRPRRRAASASSTRSPSRSSTGTPASLQYGDDRMADAGGAGPLEPRRGGRRRGACKVGYSTFPAAVTIETTAGETHSHQVDVARGNMSTPFTAEELDRKFLDCASLRLDRAAGRGGARARARDVGARRRRRARRRHGGARPSPADVAVAR